jgi:multicomponent Na+:H+ antiporter subunit D
MSMLFACTPRFLWILTVFYSAGYMRGLKEHAQTRFNTCFALALFGAIGCAFSDNLLTLYLFYEIVSVSTYPLVAHHQDAEGYEGGKKYMLYLTTTAKALILPAMVHAVRALGHLDFAPTPRRHPARRVHNGVVTALYICCILGFAKNGIMPFHHWLPGAMVAPTPVSALLHAVAVVKVGVFSTTRVMLYVFGVDLMAEASTSGLPTAYFVSFTILGASVIALSKDNLKLRLAYSTVSQLSYIILGVALLTPGRHRGRPGAHRQPRLLQDHPLLLRRRHLRGHAQEEHLRDERAGPAMPWTFGAFALAALSMIGAPPVAGFVTKLAPAGRRLDAGIDRHPRRADASTLLNAAYFARWSTRLLRPAVRGRMPHHPPLTRPVPLAMVIPL